MQKIRVTRTPKSGDQRDYALVRRQAHYIGEGEANTPVKNTMTAIPREEANIEVEGGETVVGDVNQDGFLEHMTFVGKRHSEGGMPVNIPEGSFIFSDTKKLKIKDKEILEKFFGLSYKKGGYTPAQIAKRYQINNFIQDLKNPDADAITKRSANEMLKNNMEKLGMLALVQESMKGFPDGIPAIAESAMAGLQTGKDEMAEAMMGGKVSYQTGGQKNTTGNKKLDTLIQDYRKSPSAEKAKALREAIEKSYPESGATMLFSPFMYSAHAIENPFAKEAYFEAGRFGQKPHDARNDIQKDRDLAKTLTPQAQQLVTKLTQDLAKNKDNMLPFEIKKVESEIRDLQNKIQTGKGSQIQFYIEKHTSQPVVNKKSTTVTTNNNTTVAPAAIEFNNKPTATSTVKPDTTNTSRPQTRTSAPQKKNTSAPAASAPKPTGAPKTYAELDSFFEEGGTYLPKAQQGLTTTVQSSNQVQSNTNQRVDPNQEVSAGSLKMANGEVVYLFYKGAEKYAKNANGDIVFRGKRADTNYEQYGSTNINQILAKNPNVKYTKTNFGSFAGQPNVKGTGIYLSSGNAAARQSGDLAPEEWTDFQERHGDWIDREYPGGFQKYKQDLLSGRQAGDKAAGWFQDKVNEKSIQEFGVPYFAPLNGKEDSPYKRDSKFGQVTYSVPRFFDTSQQPKTEEKPVEKKPETPVRTDVATPKPRKNGPWWLQDIVNFTGAMTDEVNRYEPTQGRVALETPGYVTEDPTRRLAANQEQMSKMQAQTENTVDGNVGIASMMGVTGQGFANAANVLGEVENRNVGIVNNAYTTNAQIENQEAVMNENLRGKYVEDIATLNQQEDIANNQKKWRQIAAFNNGTSNWFRKKEMEQVLFPDIYVDPILGDVEVNPSGNRNMLGADTYSPAYADYRSGAGFNPTAGVDAWNNIFENAKGVMGETEAKKYATSVVTNQMRNASRNVTGPTPRQQYAAMSAQGLTLPVPMKEYGGMIEFPWEEM